MTFFISGAVSLIGGLIFVILGEDGIANWAKDDDRTQDKESKEKEDLNSLPMDTISNINNEYLTQKF